MASIDEKDSLPVRSGDGDVPAEMHPLAENQKFVERVSFTGSGNVHVRCRLTRSEARKLGLGDYFSAYQLYIASPDKDPDLYDGKVTELVIGNIASPSVALIVSQLREQSGIVFSEHFENMRMSPLTTGVASAEDAHDRRLLKAYGVDVAEKIAFRLSSQTALAAVMNALKQGQDLSSPPIRLALCKHLHDEWCNMTENEGMQLTTSFDALPDWQRQALDDILTAVLEGLAADEQRWKQEVSSTIEDDDLAITSAKNSVR